MPSSKQSSFNHFKQASLQQTFLTHIHAAYIRTEVLRHISELKSELATFKNVDNLITTHIAELFISENNTDSSRRKALDALIVYATNVYKGINSFKELEEQYALFCELDVMAKSFIHHSYQGKDTSFKSDLIKIKSHDQSKYGPIALFARKKADGDFVSDTKRMYKHAIDEDMVIRKNWPCLVRFVCPVPCLIIAHRE